MTDVLAALRTDAPFGYAPRAAGWVAQGSVAMERRLVDRAAAGDHDAFASLVEDAGPRIFGIALRITRDADAAHDAVQDALLHAWRDLPRLRDRDRWDAWLTSIVVRRCYAELRRRRRAPAPTEAPTVGDAGGGLADRDELERGFALLRPDQRAVLVLRYYAGLEPSEIAEVLRIPAGTVRSRLHYALGAMRAALEADARRTVA